MLVTARDLVAGDLVEGSVILDALESAWRESSGGLGMSPQQIESRGLRRVAAAMFFEVEGVSLEVDVRGVDVVVLRTDCGVFVVDAGLNISTP